MTSPICNSVSLYGNTKICENISRNSLFSVFVADEQIFETLKLKDLELLFSQGANVNEEDKEHKMNFLQKLIVEEFSFDGAEGEELKKIAEWLYEKGININHQRADGCTTLHLAALEDDFLVLKWLLDKGANPRIVDSNGRTPFDYINSFHYSFMSDSYASAREDALILLKVGK